MDWITTSGRTLDEAKSNALDQLGIVADDAEFDVVNDVDKGLFGRVKSEAKIRARVRPKQPPAKEERSGRRRNGPGNNRSGGKSRSGGGGGRGNGNNKSDGGNREPKNNDGGRAGSGRSANSSNEDGDSSESNSSRDGGNRNKNQNQNRNRSRSGGGDRQGSSANAAPKTEKKREPVDHEISREDQEQAANEFLVGVLGAFDMSGDVAVAQEAADDDAIEMVVTGDELGLLVGQKGITLNALQELTRTVVQRKADGAKTDRLRVDVAGYRARRTAALQEFAAKIAGDVVESGTEKLLEPMGPADRKVVHDTVNDIDGVETGSEGEEPRRRVVIRPV
jgi:spoIIIJ-associated protein